ncbi:MBL fold metallo-hydrolase [Cellulomonas edaphi]|uniref:MBL fold metallo-hydrolase n=1 Tax=Cellulomonas edaphi TaxID=3053468 RepID=A0ABT7S770_9CELL|nr:MBL fold metallo-hydrolase [Cellulomons edaphi]MDM7831460.1 MBL fold metallo-hydrolase [Cellulomons edaphi]
MRVTRIGGPTVLVELDDWRILIDPTFDPPGRRYTFGLGTSSTKTRGPAIEAADVGPIDVVLVSHDQHADNLDTAGRALLPAATYVVTTLAGSRRLAAANVHGLTAGQSVGLTAAGKAPLRVTATPGRHGPALTRAIVGDVIGFAVRREDQETVALWVTGDTVVYPELLDAARSLDVDVVVVNVGGVRFPVSGPLTYTMTGSEAVRLLTTLEPRVAIPAHYDGWSHFRDGEAGLRAALRTAPGRVQDAVRWVPDGQPVDTDAPAE